MTRRRQAQKLDRDNESFETTFAWMISKVLGSAMFFFILAVAAQWGTVKSVTTARADLHSEKAAFIRSMEQVALAKSPIRPRDTQSLARFFMDRQMPLQHDPSSDVAHRT